MGNATALVTPATKPTFDQSLPEIRQIISRRRASWKLLTYLEWEDVAQELLTHSWKKYSTYRPERSRHGPSKALECWLNRLISNYLFNLKRNHLFKHARPCVGGGNANGQKCTFNKGNDLCSYTRSGKQCAECPAYALWQRTKQPLNHIKASVSIENHVQEVSNVQSDFMDLEAKKKVIDQRMRQRLEPWEWNIYRLLYIDHLSPREASDLLKTMAAKRKRPLRSTDAVDYQLVLRAMGEMRAEIINIIQQEDL